MLNKNIEVWKPLTGYEGTYEISTAGRVKSLERDVIIFNDKVRHQKERILKFDKVWSGYLMVTLLKNGTRFKVCAHILVGQHFIDNPENKPEINHKDGDKTNNWDWNLEWSTKSENQLHAIRTGLRPMKTRYDYSANMGGLNGKSRRVDQLTLSGDYIKTFDCISDARIEIPTLAAINVSRVCMGTNNSAYGYKWRYAS